jgi:thiol:disulfide interchange protein
VILACLALGAALLALRAGGAQVGWAFQLQNPGVVALLVLRPRRSPRTLPGCSSCPGFRCRAAAPAQARWAVRSALGCWLRRHPCTGPFMAAAMGVALVLPPVAGLAVFAALGLGLALPFLLIGFVPPLRLLPRPGAWMDRFRRAMAVPMGLTVVALLWLGWRQGGWGLMGAVLALALALLAVLVVVERQRRRAAAWSPGWRR